MKRPHGGPHGAPVAVALALAMFTLIWRPAPARAQELPSTIFSAGGLALVFTSDVWSLILPLGATRSLKKTSVFISGSDIFTFSAPRIKARSPGEKGGCLLGALSAG